MATPATDARPAPPWGLDGPVSTVAIMTVKRQSAHHSNG